ncbi:MAG: hypothetical protein DSY47_08090 [Hydrogenothermus sp.]|nr:MAG: hypothetical protein DSY47_08090 [Hydrogenothermus sp.]
MDGKITLIDKQVASIPSICKREYRKITKPPVVAVVDFTNNTTFDTASLKDIYGNINYRQSTVGGIVGVRGKNVGVGVYGERTVGNADVSLQSISRKVNAKLGESVAEAVEATILEIGGAKVYTRKDLKKILDEQNFQQSGLVDENTVVKLGKISGVRYIITGSINNVALKWLSAEYLKQSLYELGLVGSVLATAIESQEGWNIYTNLTVKILDTQTGQVIFSKEVEGRATIGKVPILTYDAIIGGIKLATKEAIKKVKADLSKYFSVQGYIVQIRTLPKEERRFALINLGSKQGVKVGDKFIVYTFDVIEDPISGKKECLKIKLPVYLEVTNYIQNNNSWTIIKGDEKDIKRVKIGHLVEKITEKKGKISKLLGF